MSLFFPISRPDDDLSTTHYRQITAVLRIVSRAQVTREPRFLSHRRRSVLLCPGELSRVGCRPVPVHRKTSSVSLYLSLGTQPTVHFPRCIQ